MQKIIYWPQAVWKTVVWKELASKEQESFVDLDIYIVENYLDGNSIKEFIKSFNDKEKWKRAFRDLEFYVLKKILKAWFKYISVWGATIWSEKNRDLISKWEALSIYLTASFETRAERVFDENASWNENRSIGSNMDEHIKNLKERHERYDPVYKDFSDIIVYNDNKSINQVVNEILSTMSNYDKKEV